MKRSPIQRKTPLRSKPTEEKPRAPIRKAKPGVTAAQYAQRTALTIRSGSRCEMERPNLGSWLACGRRAEDSAHVYTRPKCGKARDHVDAVIHACRACHDASEGKLGTSIARIPLRRAQAAWEVILSHSKLGTGEEDRLRIHIASVGEKPEKGVGAYAD